MKLHFCTITGADDSVSVKELNEISKDFPFVEWGILMSANARDGIPRFPSDAWQGELAREGKGLNLSAHVCGQWVRAIARGGMPENFWRHAFRFPRVQLNFHGQTHEFSPEFYVKMKRLTQQIIFQIDDVNNAVFQEALRLGVNAVPIFDLSHGAGILPAAWPKPVPGVLCTYAGGLGPENLKDQLKRIEDVVGDQTICIDMETRVRSADDKALNLGKVRACLMIAADYVG